MLIYIYIYQPMYIYIYIYTYTLESTFVYTNIYTYVHIHIGVYTRSPSQEFRLFGPRPWKILATTYENNRFLSNPDPGDNLVSGNLVMETGCTRPPAPELASIRRAHPNSRSIYKQPRIQTSKIYIQWGIHI